MRTSVMTLLGVVLMSGQAHAQSSWVTISNKTLNGRALVLEHESITKKKDDSCVVIRLRPVQEDGKEIWSGCLWHESMAFPRPVISGDFASGEAGRIVVVLGTSLTSDLEVFLYAAKSDGSEAVRATRDGKGKVSNNKAMVDSFEKPLSRERTKFATDDDCGAAMRISEANISAAKVQVSAISKLTLPGKDRPACKARVSEYDFKSKKWTVLDDGGIRLRKKK